MYVVNMTWQVHISITWMLVQIVTIMGAAAVGTGQHAASCNRHASWSGTLGQISCRSARQVQLTCESNVPFNAGA